MSYVGIVACATRLGLDDILTIDTCHTGAERREGGILSNGLLMVSGLH